MRRRSFLQLAPAIFSAPLRAAAARPNIVLIYADDLGYGDISCYGATKVRTPNLDRLAERGVRFTDAHSSAATCTPSRYALITGEYAWRRKGTGVLPGDARLIVEPGRHTLPAMLKSAGYSTGVVGKWHLGLGAGNLDWNGEIRPSALDVGFDYEFLIPATGDRVPCVYVENRRVVGLDPKDPIRVDYKEQIGSDPTGRDHPELLKLKPSHGHDMTIVNGVSRIGYMTGGNAARWVDEDMADTITAKALSFIERNRRNPFFLYFATHDVHVPRVPSARFRGTSGCGIRCDAIQQLDWCVGQVMASLDKNGLANNTLLVFTSDNGPVVDDGYADGSVENLNGHTPPGPLRGGKYSIYEAGTRIPFLARWPGRIRPGLSNALVSQVDFLASLAALTGRELPPDAGPDSFNILPALLGDSRTGRDHLVEQARGIALRRGKWKLVPAAAEARGGAGLPTRETDNAVELYDVTADVGEKRDLAAQYPGVVRDMSAQLEKIRSSGRSR